MPFSIEQLILVSNNDYIHLCTLIINSYIIFAHILTIVVLIINTFFNISIKYLASSWFTALHGQFPPRSIETFYLICTYFSFYLKRICLFYNFNPRTHLIWHVINWTHQCYRHACCVLDIILTSFRLNLQC